MGMHAKKSGEFAEPLFWGPFIIMHSLKIITAGNQKDMDVTCENALSNIQPTSHPYPQRSACRTVVNGVRGKQCFDSERPLHTIC